MNDTDLALDAIFRWFDCELKAGNLDHCNAALDRIHVDGLSEDILVGFLSATYAARESLQSRALLVERVRARLSPEIGEAETADLLKELT